MITYSSTAVQNAIDAYLMQGGQVYQLEEGSLGHGTVVLTGDNLRTCVIKEVYLNEWSSTHTVRFYRKTPQKYLDLIEKIYG